MTQKKEPEPDADVEEILCCVLDLDSLVMLEHLECMHDTITWRLELSARKICLVAQEGEVGKAELIVLEKEITCLELDKAKK